MERRNNTNNPDNNSGDYRYQRQLEYCKKNIPVLQKIENDEKLREACKEHDVYEKDEKNADLIEYLYHEFMVQAYDARMIVRDYDQLVNESGMSDCIDNPSVERLRALDSEQLLGCIAWHFRRDHFAEGSLISESIADGHMLRMLKEFVKKEDAEIA